MSNISSESSLEFVAAKVSTALSAAGIQAVLSGGAVVSIYSYNEYQSYIALYSPGYQDVNLYSPKFADSELIVVNDLNSCLARLKTPNVLKDSALKRLRLRQRRR